VAQIVTAGDDARPRRWEVPGMRTWTTTATVGAEPGAVLEVLTDPEACRRWAPVAFEVSGLEDRRLVPGSRARVTGRLAGRDVAFDLQVHEASDGTLELSATGPVGLDPTNGLRPSVPGYDLAAADGGSVVCASVGVRPGGGLLGRLLEQATVALLAAGLLDTALSRIAREAALC
jgi:hypothetical protein